MTPDRLAITDEELEEMYAILRDLLPLRPVGYGHYTCACGGRSQDDLREHAPECPWRRAEAVLHG